MRLCSLKPFLFASSIIADMPLNQALYLKPQRAPRAYQSANSRSVSEASVSLKSPQPGSSPLRQPKRPKRPRNTKKAPPNRSSAGFLNSHSIASLLLRIALSLGRLVGRILLHILWARDNTAGGALVVLQDGLIVCLFACLSRSAASPLDAFARGLPA